MIVMVSEQQIIEAIAEILVLPLTDIDIEAHLQEDLGLNPVEVADLFDNLSQKFHIILEPVETEQIKTIGNLIELIEDKMLE